MVPRPKVESFKLEPGVTRLALSWVPICVHRRVRVPFTYVAVYPQATVGKS